MRTEKPLLASQRLCQRNGQLLAVLHNPTGKFGEINAISAKRATTFSHLTIGKSRNQSRQWHNRNQVTA
jgi:hypothetical protein